MSDDGSGFDKLTDHSSTVWFTRESPNTFIFLFIIYIYLSFVVFKDVSVPEVKAKRRRPQVQEEPLFPRSRPARRWKSSQYHIILS